MTVLVRQTKKSIWSGGPPDEERRQKAIDSFRRREADTDGLSVFEVSGDEERELVIAAIACSRTNDDPVDLLEVPRDVLERYGSITPTTGTTPVRSANELHRSLDWDSATLERLANDLFDESVAAKRTKPADVRAAVRKLSLDAVDGERACAFVEAQRTRQQS